MVQIASFPDAPARKSKPAGPDLRILPDPRPLAMPVQSLTAAFDGAARRFSDSRGWRRGVVVGAPLIASAAAAGIVSRLIEPAGLGVAEIALVALFTVLFAWVAFAFASAAAGFAATWLARRDLEPWRPQPIIFTRTALLMPCYNEDPGRILAGVQAICEDLEAKGVAEFYDIFVLSDTRAGDIAEAEAVGVLRLRATVSERIFYRRRPLNVDRKAGNIADWVGNFGAGYESMIVLDADSLMSGDTIVRLTAAIERDAKAGLIQTVPRIAGARTLFARLQQFAGDVYGPLIAQGQAWWSGAEGNYWGHNAILRTRAFAACAGLPHVPGGGPFGGHIMSHDFVEAALMRRGGWAVRMAPELGGSFEETPPSLVQMAVRDRRWCQGNLQHSAILSARGLHWVSRLHLARGILAYLTPALWLVFLGVGAIVHVQLRHAGLQAKTPQAGLLFAGTMALLLGPKLMGALLVLRNGGGRRAYGGGVRFGLGVAAEILLSALMGPVLMLMQSRALMDVLRGRHSGWESQQRDEVGLTFREAWFRHRAQTLAGLAWALTSLALDPALFVWTSPVTVGLALAIPLSMLTSRADLGAACHRHGLFLTPEEIEPPAIVARAAGLRARYAAAAPLRAEIDRLLGAPAPPTPTPTPVAARSPRRLGQSISVAPRAKPQRPSTAPSAGLWGYEQSRSLG